MEKEKKSLGVPKAADRRPEREKLLVAERLAQALQGLRQNYVVEKTGIPASVLSRCVRGQQPPSPEVLTALATHFGINPTYILLGDGPPTLTSPLPPVAPAPLIDNAANGPPPFDVVAIAEPLADVIDADDVATLVPAEAACYRPVVAIAACGEAAERFAEHATGWADKFLRLPEAPRDPNAFAVQLVGQSMEPTYRDGDYVVVAPNKLPVPGQPALIVLKDNSATFKFWRQEQANFAYRLWASNKAAFTERLIDAAKVRRVFPVLIHLPLFVWKPIKET